LKTLDLKSILVAAALGAVLLWAIDSLMAANENANSMLGVSLTGAAVGAGVQIGVRLFGVS
jgi:hypothetical protein